MAPPCPPTPALNTTSSAPEFDWMLAPPLVPMLCAASSSKVSGAAPLLRTMDAPAAKVMLPAAGLPPVPVVMVTLVPPSSAALMSPSCTVELASGSKGLPVRLPEAVPCAMVTSYGSITHEPAVPIGAEASTRRPSSSKCGAEVSMVPPLPPALPPRADRLP